MGKFGFFRHQLNGARKIQVAMFTSRDLLGFEYILFEQNVGCCYVCIWSRY
jgi:hypothetical protein